MARLFLDFFWGERGHSARSVRHVAGHTPERCCGPGLGHDRLAVSKAELTCTKSYMQKACVQKSRQRAGLSEQNARAPLRSHTGAIRACREFS
jgi:hypothetical protein